MIEIVNDKNMHGPVILVIGVGGCGNNAINRMISAGMENVSYLAINTDNQALESCNAATKILIGGKLTSGFGAGANPDVGESAAVESEDSIDEAVKGADLCIITCGMGGGTGTGASPIVAKKCREHGILTVGIVTMPFSFENTTKTAVARQGVEKLKNQVDTLLVIPNDKLIGLSDKPLLLESAFDMADSVLKYAISGITNIIFNRGLVNLDFNDLKTTIKDKGTGHLGIGKVEVGEPVIEAVKKAVNSPLLETSIEGAANLLINTSGKVDVNSLDEAVNYVKDLAGNDVNIIWGTVTSQEEGDDIVVTVIATGMSERKKVTDGNSVNLKPLPQKVNSNLVENLEIPPFLSRYVREQKIEFRRKS